MQQLATSTPIYSALQPLSYHCTKPGVDQPTKPAPDRSPAPAKKAAPAKKKKKK